jgi:2-polyprenyl-3-methyl-5-hydroxy-6-metoxy-1,4-benzoquinol methylase
MGNFSSVIALYNDCVNSSDLTESNVSVTGEYWLENMLK